MFCKNCGQQMGDLALACPKCGAATSSQTQTPPPAQRYQPSAYQPPQYQQPVYQQPETAPIVSVGSFMGMILLPTLLSSFTCGIGGLILLFVWAFGSNVNPNKRNFSKATLLFMLISLLLVVLPTILFIFAFGGMSYLEDITYSI